MTERMLIGGNEIEFKSSAATPILYKKLFSKDILVELTGVSKMEDKAEQGAKMSEIIPNLAYIMYAEANMKANELFTKLNYQSYIEWLMGLEMDDMLKNGSDIIRIYHGNQKTDSKSKNE